MGTPPLLLLTAMLNHTHSLTEAEVEDDEIVVFYTLMSIVWYMYVSRTAAIDPLYVKD